MVAVTFSFERQKAIMKVVIGIDVGGSTTKIVGFKDEGGAKTLINPIFVRATDPTTSIYGAFGRFTSENNFELSDIDRIMLTGAGSASITKPLYGLKCEHVPEFSCIGRGGIYLSGLDEAIVVSMGTGTALIHSKKDGTLEYLGGTGVGGGTLVGLSRQMLGMSEIKHIEELCAGGDLGNIDLRVRDIVKSSYSDMSDDLTAANFGNVSDIATKNDIALGIVNMVSETIAMMSIFAARNFGLKDIVLTGNLTTMKPVREVFSAMQPIFGVNFIIPENSQFGTVIGAALAE